MSPSNSLAKKINLYTIIAVYFLILVGGIVRSMGAGMGCPDWPKCFGSYIPPANESLLPENYEEIYVASRVKKNARLANTLDALGFEQLADRVSNDPGIRSVTTFDVQKAWVEYINRLVGVVIGFLIILNIVFAFKFWSTDKRIVVLSVLSFILVVFQGWVGSLVVSTNLLPGFISFHMMLALLLVALLIAQRMLMNRGQTKISGKPLIAALMVLFLVQIAFGVQVREEIDLVKHLSGLVRSEWLEEVGMIFYIHRSYSLVIVGLVGLLVYQNWKQAKMTMALKSLIGVIGLEIVLGIVLAYFGMPAFAQPLHLLLGTVAFGVIFYLFLSSNLNTKHS
ncbi:MAG: COX15/CtaA family protein [Marinoscillum sp.]